MQKASRTNEEKYNGITSKTLAENNESQSDSPNNQTSREYAVN